MTMAREEVFSNLPILRITLNAWGGFPPFYFIRMGAILIAVETF